MPSPRILVCIVRSCQLLAGKKTITVYGTNRRKVLNGNVLRVHLKGCSDILLLGGCICIPFVEPTWECRRIQSYDYRTGMLHTTWSSTRGRINLYTRRRGKCQFKCAHELEDVNDFPRQASVRERDIIRINFIVWKCADGMFALQTRCGLCPWSEIYSDEKIADG